MHIFLYLFMSIPIAHWVQDAQDAQDSGAADCPPGDRASGRYGKVPPGSWCDGGWDPGMAMRCGTFVSECKETCPNGTTLVFLNIIEQWKYVNKIHWMEGYFHPAPVILCVGQASLVSFVQDFEAGRLKKYLQSETKQQKWGKWLKLNETVERC